MRPHEAGVLEPEFVFRSGVDIARGALRDHVECNHRDAWIFSPEVVKDNHDTAGGKPLGLLTDVLETGANDVYVIEGERKLMVPALKKL